MRNSSIIPALAVLLLAAGCTTVPHQTTPWLAGDAHNFEIDSPGLGWSQRYLARQGWADVYFYDLGVTWSDPAVDSQVRPQLERSISDVQQAAAQGAYSAVKVKALDVVTIDGLRFQRAVLAYKAQEQSVESHILITIFDGKLLKLRVSFHEPVSDVSRDSIAQLVGDHLAKLRRAAAI